MRHIKKILTASVIALGIFVGVSFTIAGCSQDSGMTDESHKISSISYLHQEAEVGDGTQYVLSRSNGKNASLNIKHIPTQSNAGQTFDVDASAIDSIEKICEKYGVFDWPAQAEKSDVEILDAEERSFNITLSDGSSIEFSELDKLPDDGREAVLELADIIEGVAEVD